MYAGTDPYEGLNEELETAIFFFWVLVLVLIGLFIWVIVNLVRRPRVTIKVLCLVFAGPLLLAPPILWVARAEKIEDIGGYVYAMGLGAAALTLGLCLRATDRRRDQAVARKRASSASHA